jgi:hypothetical protein
MRWVAFSEIMNSSRRRFLRGDGSNRDFLLCSQACAAQPENQPDKRSVNAGDCRFSLLSSHVHWLFAWGVRTGQTRKPFFLSTRFHKYALASDRGARTRASRVDTLQKARSMLLKGRRAGWQPAADWHLPGAGTESFLPPETFPRTARRSCRRLSPGTKYVNELMIRCANFKDVDSGSGHKRRDQCSARPKAPQRIARCNRLAKLTAAKRKPVLDSDS